YVIFIGFTLEYSVKLLIRSSDILMADKALGSFSVYCFVFFTYLSFEFCRKCKKDNIEECLQSISGGYKQVLKSQLLLLNNLILIFTAIILILQFAQYIKIGYSFNFMYIIYLFLKVVLYYYLVPITGAFFGLTFALTSNRLNSYLMLVLITLFGTPFFREILDMVYDTAEINLFPIFQIFDIFPHDLTWTPNYAFDMSILPNIWISCISWCLLLFVISFYKLSVPKTPKIILKKLPVLILCVACFITAIMPSSKVQREGCHPYESVFSEWSYYYSHNKGAESVSVVNEAFSVTDYEVEFTIGSKLYAKVKITPDNKELNEYVFTLFHEYKISKITDENNNKLKFTQDSDYVTVYTSGTINQLCFTYSGFSGTFYSNVQGTFLPGFFPYLPFPGCKAIYNTNNGGSFNVLSFGDEADINLKVHSLRKVYCNLEKNGRNTYSGKSNGLTLISGFYDEVTVNDITTVRPYMDYTRESNKNITKMINMNSDNPEFNNVKTILIMPHVNLSLTGHERYIVFSDHIVSSQTYSLMH
ncbi:MAG: hypothetical protein K2L36_02655, partial [Eubacterium sp.]|nr:hypothetical protein [Eubacterium sp.]